MKIKELSLLSAVNRFYKDDMKNGLQRRDGQIEMSGEITQAIMDNKSLAVEAEVGIGKSIAYLVPLVLQFFRERKQMIIATSTITLQEQLERDIIKVLEVLGVRADVEIAKGMKNYICLKRFQNFVREHSDYIRTYDRAKYGLQTRTDVYVSEDVWNKICITSCGEKCSDCQFRKICEYSLMRERIRNNDEIVICNQNMLVTHLINEESGKGIFKPDFSTVVIDEAHNLESKFRDAFTTSYSQNEISNEILKATTNRKDVLSSLIVELIQMVDSLFKYMKFDINQQQSEAEGDMNTYYYRPIREIRKLVLRIRSGLLEIEMRTNRRIKCLQMFRNLGNKNFLVWLSTEKGVRINVCKKNIRKEIGRLLFTSTRRTILTSGTITSQNSGTLKERYQYFMDSLGCPDNVCVSEPKKSPFDFDKHTMLYVSNKLPCPNKHNRNKYRNEAISEIVKLLEVTHGKTLILFTAKDDRDYVFKKLSNMGLPYKIMVQSSDSSQEHRLERFQNNVNSVILGTGAYWEGINIKGESLSQVIIFKLPFPVPDPITEYKMANKECPLLEVAVPEMIIKLKQGAGRLIRSSEDKGIVSILDPRVSSRLKTAYREDTLASLPEKNSTEDISELKEFWNSIKGDGKHD
jgi:ATP-dependent DNA helicase DinG